MKNLEKDLKKLGIKFKNVHLKLTKEDRARSKEVTKFIKALEKAHKASSKSKLVFKG